MKNQYVGDIHDYRKYGLLRYLNEIYFNNIMVVWMLTQDDKKRIDGNKRNYINKCETYKKYDSLLFNNMIKLNNTNKYNVIDVRKNNIIPNTMYFWEDKYLSKDNRDEWITLLNDNIKVHKPDLIYFDPNTGMTNDNTKNNNSYLYMHELKKLSENNASFLIYQHYTRDKVSDLINKKVEMINNNLDNSCLCVFRAKGVLYFLCMSKQCQNVSNLCFDGLFRWGSEIQLCYRDGVHYPKQCVGQIDDPT